MQFRNGALAGMALCVAATAVDAEVVRQVTSAEPITEARIAQLPREQQGPWFAYLGARAR